MLRPVLESHYEVQTNVPVGDAPRQADILLLRRTAATPAPFEGLWANLTTWNVLEFKGPTVSPRVRDLDLLMELGLGIDRRLNEERAKQKLPVLGRPEVSFWYVANRLGRRFLRDARQVLGPLEPEGSGIWRCSLLQRMIFLISSVALPIEADSLPLHIIGREPPATELAVARFVVEQPALWKLYGGWLEILHHLAWEEIQEMARTAGRDFRIDLRPVIDRLGIDEVVKQAGLDRVIDQVGLDRVIEHYGVEKVIEKIGRARLLAHLPLAELQGELQRRSR